MDKLILSVNNLTIKFFLDDKNFTAVNNISFQIQHNQKVGLVGESGSGKSISSMSIVKLIPIPPAKITSGEILFNNINMINMIFENLRKIRGKDIGVIFQDTLSSLSPLMRIGEQISEAIIIHKNEKLSKKNKLQYKKAVINALEKVGIPDAKTRYFSYPHELSGGMRQRIMIAMAIINNPTLLIADEPTTALDVTIQAQIMDLINEMCNDNQMSLLLITHDMGIIKDVVDYVYIMYGGEILEHGKKSDIFSNPLHPYTKGLLNSIPAMNINKKKLYYIPGTVPETNDEITGCIFSNRCEKSKDICKIKKPNFIQINNSKVRCFLYE